MELKFLYNQKLFNQNQNTIIKSFSSIFHISFFNILFLYQIFLIRLFLLPIIKSESITNIKLSLIISNSAPAIVQSPVTFMFNTGDPDQDKFVVSSSGLKQMKGPVNNSTTLINLTTTNTLRQNVSESYITSTSPYINIRLTTNQLFYRYEFLYENIGQIYPPLIIKEKKYLLIHENRINIAKRFHISDTHIYIYSYIKEENTFIIFALDRINQNHENTVFYKTKLNHNITDCSHLESEYTKDGIFCYYYNSADKKIKLMIFNNFTENIKNNKTEPPPDADPKLPPTFGYIADFADNKVSNPIYSIVTKFNSQRHSFIAAFSEYQTYFYVISSVNSNAPKLEKKNETNFLSYSYGYWKPEVFIFEREHEYWQDHYSINEEGEEEKEDSTLEKETWFYYAIFDGGNILDFYDHNFVRISFAFLNNDDYNYNYFFGGTIFYDTNRFFLSSASSSYFYYKEFSIPECFTPNSSYIITSLNESEINSDDFILNNTDDKGNYILDGYIYIPDYKTPLDFKPGYLLCITYDKNNIYESLLDYNYTSGNLCKYIKYVPYQIKKVMYEYYVFSKLDKNLYIPSFNKCNLTFNIPCYETCKSCSYLGNETLHQCTKCKSGLYFFQTSVSGKTAIGNCLEECPEGYYLNNSTCVQCYKGCKICDREVLPSDPICIECKDGYYNIEDAGLEEGYSYCYDDFCRELFYFTVNKNYLIENLPYGICKKTSGNCYSACLDCEVGLSSTQFNMRCTECSLKNYDKEAFKMYKSCINLNNKANFYYEAPYYYYCYDNCSSCDTKGLELRNNCEECKDEGNCEIWNINLTYSSLEKTDRKREFMLNYLDLNAKVYAKSGFDYRPTSVMDSYILQAYYLENPRIMSYANSINFAQVEKELREIYDIPENDSLIVAKLDYVDSDKTTTYQSEYSLYWEEDRNSMNVTKLDLGYLNSSEVIVSYIVNTMNLKDYQQALELAQYGINMYDYYDKFYQDQCFIVKLQNADISLRTRVKYYYHSADLCERNCKFIKIDYITERVICSCPPKLEINITNDDYREPTNKNVKIKKYHLPLEFGYYRCYKLINFFSLVKNIGFWIYLIILIALIVISVYVLFVEFTKINSRFEQIYHSLKIKSPYYARSKKKIKKQQEKIIEKDLFLSGFIFFIDKEMEDESEEEEQEEIKDESIVLDTGNDNQGFCLGNIHKEEKDKKEEDKKNENKNSSSDIKNDNKKDEEKNPEKTPEKIDEKLLLNNFPQDESVKQALAMGIAPELIFSVQQNKMMNQLSERRRLNKEPTVIQTKEEKKSLQIKSSSSKSSKKNKKKKIPHRQSIRARYGVGMRRSMNVRRRGAIFNMRNIYYDDEDEDNKKSNKKHRKIIEIDIGEIILKYRLFKRGRMNNYSYFMADKEDHRKCCTTVLAYFQERFIGLRVFYRQSILEFPFYNASLLIYYFAEIFYLNLIFMTPAVFEEYYLTKGDLTYSSWIAKAFYSFVGSHFVLRRVHSIENFSGTFDILGDSCKNAEKFLIKGRETLSEMKKTIIYSLIAKFLLIIFYGGSAILFCITFSSIQLNWFAGGIGTFVIEFLFSFISSALIGVIRFCGLKEKSYYAYNFAMFLNSYL